MGPKTTFENMSQTQARFRESRDLKEKTFGKVNKEFCRSNSELEKLYEAYNYIEPCKEGISWMVFSDTANQFIFEEFLRYILVNSDPIMSDIIEIYVKNWGTKSF